MNPCQALATIMNSSSAKTAKTLCTGPTTGQHPPLVSCQLRFAFKSMDVRESAWTTSSN